MKIRANTSVKSIAPEIYEGVINLSGGGVVWQFGFQVVNRGSGVEPLFRLTDRMGACCQILEVISEAKIAKLPEGIQALFWLVIHEISEAVALLNTKSSDGLPVGIVQLQDGLVVAIKEKPGSLISDSASRSADVELPGQQIPPFIRACQWAIVAR